MSFIECAGNGRSFFGSQQGTPAAGTQWGLGAIGVARWRGVPLSEILDRAGLTADAVDVMPYGLDGNVVTGGIDYGKVRRPIPVAKALDNALVALEMNGQPLPADHGFPARLIVPGWIGVANVKWIGQIEVSRQPLFSLWNTQQYVMTGPSYPTTPAAHDPGGQERLGARPRCDLPHRHAPAALRPSLVGRGRNQPRRRQRRPRRHLDRSKAAQPQRAGKLVALRLSAANLPAGTYELWARATDNHYREQPSISTFNTAGYQFGAVVRHPITLR